MTVFIFSHFTLLETVTSLILRLNMQKQGMDRDNGNCGRIVRDSRSAKFAGRERKLRGWSFTRGRNSGGLEVGRRWRGDEGMSVVEGRGSGPATGIWTWGGENFGIPHSGMERCVIAGGRVGRREEAGRGIAR